MIYENCKVDRYHDFTVLASPYTGSGEVQFEQCKLCGEQKQYKFNTKGQMVDSNAYFLDHIRAFCQNASGDRGMQAAYEYCNPKAFQKFIKEAKDKLKSDDFQAEMSDKFKFAMKRALNNEGWTDKESYGFDRSSKEK